MPHARAWVDAAVRTIEADFRRSADTHLIHVELPFPGIRLYLKDESTHPTGSLKHRLARSLFLYALCNGWIGESTTVVEASSGSTAISEAYFARLLGLPFITVVPATTQEEKIAQIAFHGGRCQLVADGQAISAEAVRLAAQCGGHFMDQFTYAERATDWRGNNNIAESILGQMRDEPDPVPRWIVMSAGTGGTSATLGRFIRYRRLATRLCVVDPEYSVFHAFYRSGDRTLLAARGSRIEGIGRPRVEPSFIPGVIDRMLSVPDAASLAAIRFLERLLGRKCGGSTGTNLIGAVCLIAGMLERGETGSVVTLICDGGERYLNTYYDDAWLAAQGLDLAPWLARLTAFWASGRFDLAED